MVRGGGVALIGAAVLWTGGARLKPLSGDERGGLCTSADGRPATPVPGLIAGLTPLSGGRPVPDGVVLEPPPLPFPAQDVPDEGEIWGAFLKERFERPRFLVEKIEEKAEPCLALPLIGPIRRVSSRMKCTIYFDERVRGEVRRDASAVVFVEKARVVPCGDRRHVHGTALPNP